MYRIFITVLLFVTTSAAFAAVGLPQKELAAEKKHQPYHAHQKNHPKPKVINRTGINSDDPLMDLNISPPRAQRVFDSAEVSFDHAPAYLGKIQSLRDALAISRAAFGRAPSFAQQEGPYIALSPFDQWQAFLSETRYVSPKAQIENVQRFVNRTPYDHDSDATGMGDTWKDPAKFLEFGGDSEDFAITKYISLRLLGIAPERLRIAVVFDKEKQIYRALLLVYSNTDILILDEKNNEINTSKNTKNIAPVYSFNEYHIWYHWKQGSPPPTQFLQTETQKNYKIFP